MLKLAVIGDPISHTLSPVIHSTVMKHLGVELTYLIKRVPKSGLLEFIDFAKQEKLDGFNLTMPHKVDIIEYLDEIDDEAALVHSVNTVTCKNGRLRGYSTDAGGFYRSLLERGGEITGKTAVLLGAGGAANSLALKALQLGAKGIVILNRDEQRARALRDAVSPYQGEAVVAWGPLDEETFCSHAADADFIINATPLGMEGTGKDFGSFGFLDLIKRECMVCDLIYNPPETKLLKAAKQRGLACMNGLGMLIYQALLSDEIYLGRKLNFRELNQVVQDALAK